MAGSGIEPPPFQTPLTGQGGTITKWWADWFLLVLLGRVQAQPPIVVSPTLTAQNASIATTSLVAAATAGWYRISWYFRITTVGSVSSSLQVTITTTDGGVTITQSGAAATGNTTATVQSGSVLARVDPSTPISYSTTYASNAANEMEYSLFVSVEALTGET